MILYFITQSNIISAVEKNEFSFEEVENWLEEELGAFFETKDTTRGIHFGNWMKFLQKYT